MLVKKLLVCILLFFVGLGLMTDITSAAPNAKECIEGKVECDELENNSNKSNVEAVGSDNGSLLFDLVKMVFALILVLALIYLLLKFLNKRNKLFNQVKALENIGGISVGQNKSIQIIRIGSRVYVVGVGDSVELLQEITSEEEKEELLHINQTNQLSAGSLTSLFSQKKEADRTNQSTMDFKKLFSTELDKLKNGRQKIIDHHKRKGDKHE